MNGELLRKLREAAGIKQLDLALAAGIDNSALSLYESGRRGLTAEVAGLLVALIDSMLSERTDEYLRLRARATDGKELVA